MIHIYSPSNTDYSKNGDMVLLPTECTHNAILCGVWELSLSHPRDAEGRWKYIVEGAVLSVPTFMGNGQLFRIYEVEKTNDEVTCSARPIFFDSAKDVFLLDVRPTNRPGASALALLTNGTKYTTQSNITKQSTAYYVRKNLIEALNGEDDNSFINRWGGEPLYQNFHVIFNERAGSDNGVLIHYGKNIESITETINTDELITRIVPESYNGYLLDGASPWVNSPLINSYPVVCTAVKHYEHVKLASETEGDPSEDDIICEDMAELRAKLIELANADFESGCDKPSVTLDIDMIDLAQTDEYKEYAVLETVRLGDTVHCVHNDLGIDTSARVTEMDWDCIHNCISRVVIGDVQYDYFSNSLSDHSAIKAVRGIVDNDGDIMASRIAGVLNMQKTNLRFQRNVAQQQVVRAILFEDLDPNSPTFGAMCLGTQGLQISRQRNAYNTDWVWGTAIDFQSIYANYLITGTISDKTGSNYWDLDTGRFKLSSGTLIDGQSDNTIGGILTRISTTEEGLSAEVRSRTDRDGELWEEFDGRLNVTSNAITTEVTDRQNGDNGVRTELTGRITNLSNRISLEVQNRIDRDDQIAGSVTVQANRITSEVNARKGADTEMSSRIEQTEQAIALRVTAGQVESIIETKADSIRLKTANLSWTATNSSLTADGTLTVNKGVFKGTLTSPTGTIGGWTLAANRLYNIGVVKEIGPNDQVMAHNTYTAELRGYNYSSNRYMIVLTHKDELASKTDIPFVLTYDGRIIAKRGDIGDFHIGDGIVSAVPDGMYTGAFTKFMHVVDSYESNPEYISCVRGIYLGSNGITINDGTFVADKTGLVRARTVIAERIVHVDDVSDVSVIVENDYIAVQHEFTGGRYDKTAKLEKDRLTVEDTDIGDYSATYAADHIEIRGNNYSTIVRVEDAYGISTDYDISCNAINSRADKSRIVDTTDYGTRKLYCYEMPSPMFGDIGSGVIGDDGLCYVSIDPVFSQTIASGEVEYQVFLQPYGDGNCYVKSRNNGYFVVAGDIGLSFGWEMKAKQRDYELRRLDVYGNKIDISSGGFGHADISTIDYGAEALEHIKEIEGERNNDN